MGLLSVHYTSKFRICRISAIYEISSVHIHRDFENFLADWDEISIVYEEGQCWFLHN